MAQLQRNIRPELKRALIAEAGGKCANPGCSNWRVHIHHIKQWAVYKANEAPYMIAICPSCHDATHYGRLKITDELLYLWKGIHRPIEPNSAHIYIEPALELKMIIGSICIATKNDQAVVFELSNMNHLKFRVLDQDILQVNVRLQDKNGKEILRVVENHVRVNRNENIVFDYRAGHARITVPVVDDFAPAWLINQVRVQDPTFAVDGQIIALDIEVLKPGLVRVRGCWPGGNVGVVITDNALSFCKFGLREPLSLVGAREVTILIYAGPITSAMFGFDIPTHNPSLQSTSSGGG